MRTENVHTLILGAGPSGLAAGYTLAKAGCQPVILEKDKVPGGLMRSIRRGDFIVDVGRKERHVVLGGRSLASNHDRVELGGDRGGPAGGQEPVGALELGEGERGLAVLALGHAERQVVAEGFDLQLHTNNHRNVIENRQIVRDEVRANRRSLEPLSGRPAVHFCYPLGLWQRDVWPDYQGGSEDALEVEIFQHWLERA